MTSSGPGGQGGSWWSRRSRSEQIRAALITTFGTILAAVLTIVFTRGSSSNGSQSSTSLLTQSFFTVSAEQGWQKTPFSIDPAHSWSLHQDSGAWTVDHYRLKLTGAGGYDSAYDHNIYRGCKFDESQPYGYLLAKVGPSLESAELVYVGGDYSGTWLSADGNRKVAGPIWLRINDKDECLGENGGSIRVVFGPDK